MKIILSLLAVAFSAMNFLPEQQVSVISSYCYLYQEASFLSEKVKQGNEDLIIYHGNTLEVIQEEGDFVYVNVKVEQNYYTGYVYRYYITSNSPQIVYPVFNGNVRVDNAIIYDMDFNPTQYVASKNQGVFIYEGFSSEEYTAIQLILEDGSLYNGYIKTVDLTPQGISPLLIVGISIIAACVTIILSLLFIKKRKKK